LHGQFGKTCERVSIGLISDYFGAWPKVTGSAMGVLSRSNKQNENEDKESAHMVARFGNEAMH